MTKVFISQPMKGKTEQEILKERANMFQLAKESFPDAELIDSYFDDYEPSTGNVLKESLLEQLHEAKYSKPTLAEWLAERDAQLCNIDIDGWKGHLPVPKEWTIDTVMSIIRNAAPKYED